MSTGAAKDPILDAVGPDAQAAAEAVDAVARALPQLRWDRVRSLGVRPGKARVFVVWGADHGRRIVAKLQDADLTTLESRVYLDVLSELALPSVECFGAHSSRIELGHSWLLTDFAGGHPFDSGSRGDRRALTSWVSAFHRGAPSVVDSSSFPVHGPEYWEGVLAEAVVTLDVGLANPALGSGEARDVSTLRGLFVKFLERWDEMATMLDAFPRTLTHGDLVPQNVTMEGSSHGRTPLVIDWGETGWSSPAIDLMWVDAVAYATSVGAELAQVRRARALGLALWTAFVLAGDRVNLESCWPDQAARKSAYYVEALMWRGAVRMTEVP